MNQVLQYIFILTLSHLVVIILVFLLSTGDILPVNTSAVVNILNYVHPVYWVNSLYGIAFGDDGSIAN